jgi:hypothetical protein
VGNAGEYQHVRNAVGQIVEDLAACARLVRRERHHAVEHVEPQADVAEKRRNEEKPR